MKIEAFAKACTVSTELPSLPHFACFSADRCHSVQLVDRLSMT